ncbi:TPA: cob(I)yrinic acid a,c-diamide adenosyltransferase [Patescibacteria group bacterium]|nr:cob(I)yrinic acid a,c-diamide adenosyltransferase [Patescibacteria group bacterium]
MTNKTHYIHLYYGDGKGKTTAALGLALRATGHGQKVVMLQWLKGRPDIGEVKVAKLLGKNFVIHQSGPTYFTWDNPPVGGEANTHKKLAIAGLKKLEQIVAKTKYDILILDEIIDAVNMQFIPKSKVISLVKRAVAKGEVIITGHNPDKDWLKLADLSTEMKKVKHYFKRGQGARKGIEF